MLNIAVLISGSGTNLKALLDATQTPTYPARVAVVVSDTEAPGLVHAQTHSVPTVVVRPNDDVSREEWGRNLETTIRAHGVNPEGPHPGLVVSAGFMRILPATFVAAFSPRLINTHPSLLPCYPGAHAVRDTLLGGAVKTGVTVHVIDEGVDTGPVLRQKQLSVLSSDTEHTLHERIKQVERPLLVETVREIALGTLDPGQTIS